MAKNLIHFFCYTPIRSDRVLTVLPACLLRSILPVLTLSPPNPTFYTSSHLTKTSTLGIHLNSGLVAGTPRRNLTALTAVSMFSSNQVLHDVCVAGLAGGVALSLIKFWGETAKRRIFDQKLNRKLVHLSIGLVFMLFWPMFSDGPQAAVLAALIPGVNIIRMLLLGLGILKDDAIVKSMSRHGDPRELLKGPLYYATTISLASLLYWRTSPMAIAAICNLCAGDGLADIVGRRFGYHKLPYNREKSYAGSIAMATAGFVSCVGYMHYFSLFGFIHETWGMVFRFLIVSLVAALVESLPVCSELDDNLTVPLTSLVYQAGGVGVSTIDIAGNVLASVACQIGKKVCDDTMAEGYAAKAALLLIHAQRWKIKLPFGDSATLLYLIQDGDSRQLSTIHWK